MKLLEAAQLNHQGTVFLAAGNYAAAYRAFSKSAVLLKSLPVAEDQVLKMGPGGHVLSASIIVSSSFGSTLTAFQELDFFVCNRSILFHPNERESHNAVLTDAQKRLCVATVMFNMALGRHVQARQQGKDSLLRKALSLYAMGMEVVQYIPHRSECLIVLVIATLNNMAHLHYELGEISQAKRLLECVSPMSASLSEATALQCQVDECLMNLLVTNFVATARCA